MWESPDGCLMFSAVQRLEIPGQRLPFVQYIVSLAIVQAVRAAAASALQVRTSRSYQGRHAGMQASRRRLACHVLLVTARSLQGSEGLSCAAFFVPFCCN